MEISVFSWRDAPQELKALTPFGGDEQWVVFHEDPDLSDEFPAGDLLVETLSEFGRRCVSDPVRGFTFRGRQVCVWIILG